MILRAGSQCCTHIFPSRNDTEYYITRSVFKKNKCSVHHTFLQQVPQSHSKNVVLCIFWYFYKWLEVNRWIYCGNMESGVSPFRLAIYTLSCKKRMKIADTILFIERKYNKYTVFIPIFLI